MPDQNPSVLIVIPARLSSQRLPGKMLLHETGKPLLQHTWEAVRQVKKAEQVVVATDHEDIRSTVEGFGGNAVMTSPTAPNGTARIVEALSQFPNAEIIEVISASFGFKDLIHKIGVQRRVYTAGKNKSTLDPFVEEKEEDVKRLKNIQLELHADFIKVVETSRGSKLKDPEKNNIFTGEFWTGKASLKLGLIDGIGNADQVLKDKFGDKVIIKTFEKPKGFIARKLSSSFQDPVEKLANIIEEKSMWQRFGL
jgi:bifunctional N-acetylglucosamine-1-phosphate-uridyltransferase/glucosamine-1-phosphate-acetyltransferase GlmU-like protein